jgi:pyruvate,water dikinase
MRLTLGLSFFLLTTNAPMRKAGGRLFVDVTPLLASPASRESILDVMGHDPLIKDALMTIIERGDFIQSLPDDKQEKTPGKSNQGPSLADYKTLNEYDPAIVADLMKRSETSIELKQISKRSRD